jgi:type II secretory pathway pseudopilin PulG
MNRGQISTELLVIVAVVLAIFVPLLVAVYFKANEANAQIGSYQAELAVFRLAYLANSVGALGTETSVTTDVYIPPGVTNITIRGIEGGGEVIFKIQTTGGESELVEIIKYPIKDAKYFSATQGWATFNISSHYDSSTGEAVLEIDSVRG